MIELILYILGGANHYILWVLPDLIPGKRLTPKQILSLTFWPVTTIITMASLAWLYTNPKKKEPTDGIDDFS